MLFYYLNKNYFLNDCEWDEDLKLEENLKIYEHILTFINKLTNVNVQIFFHKLNETTFNPTNSLISNCKVHYFQKTFAICLLFICFSSFYLDFYYYLGYFRLRYLQV